MCLAIPGKVIDIHDDCLSCLPSDLLRTGKVDFGGVVREVSLALVPDVRRGDYVLVHVGMALARIDEEEAGQVFSYLRQMAHEEEP
jgi:hydrogenase expression/formation protein HypC